MGLDGVARGGFFLFVGSIIAAILGYLYWFVISILSGVNVVGIANSVVSLGSLISGIAILGLPTGVQRFLGRSYGNKDVKGLNLYFWTSLIFTLGLCLISALAVWIMAILNVSLPGFSDSMSIAAGLMISLSFSGIMVALLASILRTEFVAVSSVISSLTKLGLGILLVYLGFGWLGAVLGVILSTVCFIALLMVFALRELRRLGAASVSFSAKALRDSLQAGLVDWLPGAVILVGQQLSVLAVFSLQGSFDAGTYSVAYIIFSIVYSLPSSLMFILFPVLSGMAQEGKELAWKALKVTLALTSPMAVFLVFYSWLPLSLMGAEYVQAAPALSLLALSTIPLTLISGVNSLIYASGSYGKVLGIGLAMSLPRIALYFLLVPIYSGYGAAASFLVGSLVGLGAASYVSRKIRFRVSKKIVTAAILVPVSATLVCLLTGLPWYISGSIVLMASFVGYGRLGVVRRSDLAEIARAFASEKTIAKVAGRFNWLLKVIYGS